MHGGNYGENIHRARITAPQITVPGVKKQR